MSSSLPNSYVTYLAQALSNKNRRSKEHVQQYRQVFANNRHAAGFTPAWKEFIYTLMIEQAEGAYIYDMDDNKYLDVTMGFGVHLFGHHPSRITAAIQGQMDRSMALGPLTPLASEVAQLLHEITGVERSAFFNSGTEAVMVALRLARAATGKDKIVLFSGSYHGTADHVLVFKKDSHTHQGLPLLPGIPEDLVKNVYWLEYSTAASLRVIENHAHEIAAVLVEPIQSRNPALQPAEYLQQLRQLTARQDITLIFDEVITGFRIALGGAQAYFGIQADLVTYGKIVGGGMPIGIVAGKKRYMDYIDGGFWTFGDDSIPATKPTFVAGTFCHHPLAMAAAKESLLTMQAAGGAIQNDLNEKTRILCTTLNAYFQEQHIPIKMVYFGSLFRFQLKGNAKLLYYQLLLEGVYIWEGRNCFLSTAHSEVDLAFLIRAVQTSCEKLMAAGIIKTANPSHSSYSGTIPIPKPVERLLEKANAPVNFFMGVIHLNGHLQTDYLLLSICYVVNRYEMTRVVQVDGQGMHLKPTVAPHIQMADFSSEQNPKRSASLFISHIRNQGASLASGPFYQFGLIKLSDKQFQLFLNTPKWLMDGWSMIILFREIAECYNAFVEGNPVKLRNPNQFTHFLHWVNADKFTPDAPPGPAATTPFHQVESSLASYCPAASLSRTLDKETTAALKAWAKREGCTLFQLLTTIYAKLLQHITQSTQVVFGVPVAGQLLMRVVNLVGPCTSILPVHINLASAPTLKLVTRQVAEALSQNTRAFTGYYQQVQSSAIRTVFNLDKIPEGICFRYLQQKIEILDEAHTSYDLVFNVLDTGTELGLTIKYNREKYVEVTIHQWMDYYQECMLNQVIHPQPNRAASTQD
jgi:glutamate-1-semialdehyde aminotransferase